jgi:tetratricopeptide (TPR) repeat protein
MLHARDRYGAAVVEYRKATRLMGENHPVVMTRLAQSLIALERPDEALDSLRKVKGSFPGYVQTWIELGRAAVRAKRWDEAREFLEEAARINPFDPTIYDELEVVYRELGMPEALRLARKHRKLVM